MIALLLLPALWFPQEETVTVVATSDLSQWEGVLGAKSGDLRVCLGGTLLSSHEGRASKGAFSIEALREAAFDAVGLAPGERIPADSGVPFVSDRPIVKTCGGVRLAIVAWNGADGPEERIARARAEGDLVILLAWASKEEALAKLEGVDLCLVRSLPPLDPLPFQIGKTWIADVPRGGRAAARLTLRVKARALVEVTGEIAALPAENADRTEALRRKHSVRPESEEWLDKVRLEKAPDEERPSLPDRLERGAVLAPGTRGRSRAVEVLVHRVSMPDRYGAIEAAPGRRLILVNAELTNLMPLTLLHERKVPTEYRIADLREAVYLIVNGRSLGRLRTDSAELPGHLRARNLALPQPGSYLLGNLLFETTEDDVTRLELRLYDFAHGHVTVPLVGREKAEEPLARSKNDVAEFAIFAVRKTREHLGAKAPEGATFLILDLRARSLVEFEVDATAFDPKAKPGEKRKSGTVMDFAGLRDSIHLLIDGTFVSTPRAGSPISDDPRFLPDVPTGELLVWLVPEKWSSLELICEFENLRMPDRSVIRPARILLTVEGKRPPVTDRPALATAEDRAYRVSVHAAKRAATFAGHAPSSGNDFLVLDLTVENRTSEEQRFQPGAQLKCLTESRKDLDLSAATADGPLAPGKAILVPAGERRSFQVAFEIAQGDAKPKLDYRGVGKGSILDLPLDGPSGRLVCPKCGVAAPPESTFCDECGTRLKP